MLTAAAPPSPNPKSNPNHPSKTGRRPLQPKNHLHHHVNNNNNNNNFKPKLPKTGWIEISSLSTADNDESNKENPHNTHPPTKKKSQFETKTTLDASLAEELSAIREKLERMRFDKDETEKMLRERDLVLDMQMNQLLERGQIQRMLEIEVDRLYRLNQLRSSCLISPIRSLRDKEQENKIREDNLLKEREDGRTEDRSDERKSGSTSPNHQALELDNKDLILNSEIEMENS